MISVKEAEEIHKILINNFGGSHGVRDLSALESALIRPFQKFDNKELYPDLLTKCAALLESLLINHPFVDGNKRIGYTLTRYFLLKSSFEIDATQEAKYDFIIKIASGKIDFDSIVDWLRIHTKNIS